MADHDSLYHQLFSDPAMVAQLLRQFVAEPWLDELDLNGIARENAKFHADTGERREGDMVWRIPRHGGGETFLMLLLEFQSTPNHWMALRAMVYAGLLWQHLLREKRLLPDGRLPPIFPVVLYNGEPRWAAPLNLRELVGLPEGSPLWQWQPDMRYHIVDEGGFDEADLTKRDGLLPLVFRLESSPTPEQVVALTDAALAWFAANPALTALRQVFVSMLRSVMEPLAPGMRVPEELLEVRNMLSVRAEVWRRLWLVEGGQETASIDPTGLIRQQAEAWRQKYLEQGRQEGRKRAAEEAMQKWLQEVEEKGRQEGRQEGERKGEAALLLRQLQRRFGMLPDWVTERIDLASTDTLEEWGLRVLEAGSLDEVFA
jgi:hypothetical protein